MSETSAACTRCGELQCSGCEIGAASPHMDPHMDGPACVCICDRCIAPTGRCRCSECKCYTP